MMMLMLMLWVSAPQTSRCCAKAMLAMTRREHTAVEISEKWDAAGAQ